MSQVSIRSLLLSLGMGRLRRQRGAAMAEMIVAAPLCIVFAAGILAYGRAVKQLTWVNQSAYLGALSGGQTSRDFGIGQTGSVYGTTNELVSRQDNDLESFTVESGYQIHDGTGAVATSSVRITATVKPLFMAPPITIVRVMYAPYLITESVDGLSVDEFTEPGNYYDCDGVAIPGCTDITCAAQTCP